MGVPSTVPYNNDITALPACQPGREKKEMLIVISISPLTQNISGSVHVDNRSQVVRSVCDLCSPTQYLGSDECALYTQGQ